MSDKGKIFLGLIVFLGAVTFPVWGGVFAKSPAPEVTLPANEKNCIESREYMVANHMNMLDSWRDNFVRQGQKTYIASDGKEYDISLTKTCMKSGCHDNKAEFCDKCHTYADVDPYCWDCHVSPDQVAPKGGN
jgi:hypothetical protein